MGGDESRRSGDEDVLGLICSHCDVNNYNNICNIRNHVISSNRWSANIIIMIHETDLYSLVRKDTANSEIEIGKKLDPDPQV